MAVEQKGEDVFSVDQDKTIVYGGSSDVDEALCFNSAKQLAELADAREWSREFLEEIWNSFAGAVPFDDLKPVKKFRNRPFAIRRIWEVIQRLVPGGAAPMEPESALLPKAILPKAKKEKKPRIPKEQKPKRVVGNSKKDQAAALMLRKSGATVEDFRERLGWNEGSVTMFVQWISWVLRSGIKSLASEKNSKGERVYRAV